MISVSRRANFIKFLKTEAEQLYHVSNAYRPYKSSRVTDDEDKIYEWAAANLQPDLFVLEKYGLSKSKIAHAFRKVYNKAVPSPVAPDIAAHYAEFNRLAQLAQEELDLAAIVEQVKKFDTLIRTFYD